MWARGNLLIFLEEGEKQGKAASKVTKGTLKWRSVSSNVIARPEFLKTKNLHYRIYALFLQSF
jgi:hypothetical protein